MRGQKLIQHPTITCCDQLSELNEELNLIMDIFVCSHQSGLHSLQSVIGRCTCGCSGWGPGAGCRQGCACPGKGLLTRQQHWPLLGTKAVCSALLQGSVVVYICNNKTEAQRSTPNLMRSFAWWLGNCIIHWSWICMRGPCCGSHESTPTTPQQSTELGSGYLALFTLHPQHICPPGKVPAPHLDINNC